MFATATRIKLRFESPKGALSVEDLWDLPLTSNTGRANLDDMAVGLFRKVKASGDVSFVTSREDTASADRLKFDIVKHILDTRVAERDAAKAAAQAREKKQQLMDIINQKENQALADMPLDELRKMVDSL